jgi:alpha-glucosidase
MLAARKRSPALQSGGVRILKSPDGVLAFERRTGDECVLCAFELAGQSARFDDDGLDGARMLGGDGGGALVGQAVTLPPYAFAWMRRASAGQPGASA